MEEDNSKYISKEIYNDIKETKKSVSTTKYLSSSEFKNRLKKK